MKRKLTGFLLIGLLLCVTGVAVYWKNTSDNVFRKTYVEKRYAHRPVTEQDSIWVITDLHYFSDKLHDRGKAFQLIKNNTNGIVLDYQQELMEALIWQIEQHRPRLLIIPGDLTFNGEKQSAVELADYLARIEALETQVYVIPGNHDLCNGWSKTYYGESPAPAEQLTPAEFSELFNNMGYSEAISRDSRSLSYAVCPFEDLMLLMLDSSEYAETDQLNPPVHAGRLTPQTMDWAADMLAYAKTNDLLVIPVIHHNLMAHNEQINKGFVLDNATDIQKLFSDYALPVSLSGHSHAQNIACKQIQGHHICDIVTGCFASLSNCIGKITVSPRQIHYKRAPLNVAEWAKATRQTNPDLLNYSDYSYQLFFRHRMGMANEQMYNEHWFDVDTADQIAAFAARVNTWYFDGCVPLSDSEKEALEHDDGYLLLQQQEDSFLRCYLEDVLSANGENHCEITIQR